MGPAKSCSLEQLRLGQAWTTVPTSPSMTLASTPMCTTAMIVQDVAPYLSIDPKTIYRMVNRGGLPGFKVGGSYVPFNSDFEPMVFIGGEGELKIIADLVEVLTPDS